MTDPTFSAVLWDMDGTLVDTEPYWMDAETRLVAAWGGVWTHEDALQLIGSPLERSALILQSRGVDLTTEEIIATLTDQVMGRLAESVPWRPGARELLLDVREAGIPTALVTMSFRRMAEQIAGGFAPYLNGLAPFDAIIAGDEVEHGKPHPEAFLRGAAALGIDPTDCVAIEDSEFGVAAAVASGATTVAVPSHVPLPESHAYTLWTTLAGRGLDDLAALHARRAA